VETLFFSRRLSFCRLLLVDWRREAVSQLLWSDKDREVWFFLEKNHEKVYRFPDFLQRGTQLREAMCGFLRWEAACSSVAPKRSTGNPGSVYTNCETALAVRARNVANPSSQELLCPRKFHPILSAKGWGLVRHRILCHRILK
jgi:hypothetical protein